MEDGVAKNVLLIENDLFFSSKITDVLKQIGMTTVLSTKQNDILKLLDDPNMCLVIVDLSLDSLDTLTLLQRLKEGAATSHIPVIAFAEHTQHQLLQGARDAGCEVVVNNRQVVQNLKDLVEVSLSES